MDPSQRYPVQNILPKMNNVGQVNLFFAEGASASRILLSCFNYRNFDVVSSCLLINKGNNHFIK